MCVVQPACCVMFCSARSAAASGVCWSASVAGEEERERQRQTGELTIRASSMGVGEFGSAGSRAE